MLLVDEHVRLIDSYLFSRIILEDILDFNLKLYFTLANLSIRKRIFYIHNFGQQVMTLVNIPLFDVLGKTNCLTSFLAPCKGFNSICEIFCLRSATILCVRTSRLIKYCPELSPHTYWPQRKMVREEEWREIFSASSMRLPFFYSKL